MKVIFPKADSSTAAMNVGDYVLVKVGFDCNLPLHVLG